MDNSLILFAFGFGNLAMLGWLAAAAAPLLIHLWSRHRFREAPWAAMQFLLAAMRKNARRLQLQQWLLLAVRTLIIGLVVTAAAEPYGERLLAGGGGRPAHRILVIDGSYSMAYRDQGPSRFERARQLAAALVRDGRPADTFTLILMAAPARTILGREVVDRATVLAEIESLSQPHTGADLAGALSLVQESLTAKASERSPAERQEVYFFTDLQRTTWGTVPGSHAPRGNPLPSRSRGAEPAPATQSVEELRSHAERGNEEFDRFAALAQQAPLTLIDVGQPDTANLAVTRLTTPEAFPTLNREIVFEATLQQFGPQPRTECTVELLVDDVPVGAQTIDVAAGGTAAVRFTHRFRAAGSHTITVRVAADGLSVDDVRYLAVPVREAVRVLCVAGRDGAARYVARALDPNGAADSPIRPVTVSEGDLAELELADFECILMCNVAQLTAGEAQRLRRYAADGGGVVFFLGDRVVPSSYNAVEKTQAEDLLPALVGELVTGAQFGLDPLDYRHPIVAPFRGRERAGLLTTPVSRYYRLELPEDRPDVALAAALPNGDPFLVTAPLGRGRTVLVATAASLASVDRATGEPWTNWPTWPSFLPIVREIVAFAASGRQMHWQQSVGAPLGGTLNAAPPATAELSALQIARPDGRVDPVSVQPATTGWEWTYGDTNASGIYALRGVPDDESRQFAVNVDTSESNLAKADPRQLPPELSVRHTWQETTDDAASGQITQAGWDQSLLWLVLALLFTESFLAWRFGRGTV